MWTFIAVMPNGYEHWGEFSGANLEDERSFKQNLAQAAVYRSGLTCDRNKPINIQVDIRKLVVQNHVPAKVHDSRFFVDLPFRRMNEKEFEEAMQEALKDLPEEFAGFVSSKAWDDGHSAGYEEVVNLATDMSHSLGEAFKKYSKRISK